MKVSGTVPRRRFPETSWMLLDAARGASPEARAAMEEFAARYRQPTYAYLAAIVRNPEEAEELAQGFFADVVASGRLLARVDRSRGSFRPYLKQALRNYVASKKRRRIPEQVYPDAQESGWEQLDLRAEGSPEAAFHRAWVQKLLAEALAGVRQLCEEKNQQEHYALFEARYLSPASAPPSWRELGQKFGLDEKAARSRAETVARHFRVVLREMLVAETGSEAAADEEVSTLLAFL